MKLLQEYVCRDCLCYLLMNAVEGRGFCGNRHSQRHRKVVNGDTLACSKRVIKWEGATG